MVDPHSFNIKNWRLWVAIKLMEKFLNDQSNLQLLKLSMKTAKVGWLNNWFMMTIMKGQ